MIPVQYVTLECLTQEELDILVTGLRLVKKEVISGSYDYDISTIWKLLQDMKPYTSDFKSGKDIDTEEYLKQLEELGI